ILIGQRRYVIVGVVEERKDTFFGLNAEGTEVIIPFTTKLREEPNLFYHVEAAAVSTDLAPEAAAELDFFMRARRGIGPLDKPNFAVEYLSSIVDSFNNMAAGITVLATGVVAISLAVGGVGIMNIMLVSVSERTREIGLRKAVGARPAAILFQFLVEAVVLCTMGGLIGILIGWGVASGLKGIPQLKEAYIPGWAIALAFFFSAGVGLIFGMFPAIKAARLDPIDALRHE
ncbi:MAG TPA: FtsX-like permease family protein, partial [Tepidisphaeraceae bacterium]|nr:FtsX-like permease family protein [Tepidisphaeraceae bacterium]